MTDSGPPSFRRTAALRYPDFRYYQAGRFAGLIGTNIQSVAIGWEVYSLTGRALDLGWVGLAQFLPAFLLFPLTGHAADRYDRRGLLTLCHVTLALAAILFYLLSRSGTPPVGAIYAILVLVGTARAFAGPAGHALVPNLVPRKEIPSALGWGSSIFELSRLIGPAIGGLLLTVGGATVAFLTTVVLECASVALLLAVRTRSRGDGATVSFDSVGVGLKYVLSSRILLGAISLDLFAVLLGGAVALAPIFARDVLLAGPTALGLLRSAPAVGASLMGLWLAQRAPTRHMGRWMFACVFLFGVATIVFGVSKDLWLSLTALAVAGAADMVSVYVRHLLVQLTTPDAMRGRVAAVNLVFIGASNELGEFESGLTAEWLGAVRAAVLGGIGTCVVVAVWAALFPELRRVDRLDREVA